MNIEGVKTFDQIGEQLKPKWELDMEYFENTNHSLYFVMDGNRTVATCRRREDAEQIVRDHNGNQT